MNYLKIASGVNFVPLLLAINRKPHLWDRNPARLMAHGPHAQSHDIWIRYKDETENKSTGDYSNFSHEHEPIWYPAYRELPEIQPLIFGLMGDNRICGERLGGILIYKLEPGKRILAHIDTGWHVDYYEKFNVCLASNPNTRFHYAAGDDMYAVPGDVHWFRNDVEHEVINDGDTDHVILTVCIKTPLYQGIKADAQEKPSLRIVGH